VPFRIFVTLAYVNVEFTKFENGAQVSFMKVPVLLVPNMYPLTFALSVHKTLKVQEEFALVPLAEILEYVGGLESGLPIN
jgi:hypothetical protein